MNSADLAVLKLDTQFPRLPGDIACSDSYSRPVRLQTIVDASIDAVVSHRPDRYDISDFEQAVRNATEPLITSSCGFMIYFQDHLNKQARQPFVSSALTALPALRARYADDQILILTFDAEILCAPAYEACLDGFTGALVGLDKSSHLYQTIKHNQPKLDAGQVADELAVLTDKTLARHKQTRVILLECTNLAPFKSVFRAHFDGKFIDSLTILENLSPGLVKPEFLI